MKRNKSWTHEQKKKALHEYIRLHLKITIPTTSICHNHDAPFDALYAAFMELYDLMIWLANRNGGKTMDFAILAILDSEANDSCESANFGAIKKQALKCYSYIKTFLQSDQDLTDSLEGDITMGGTHFKNKSTIEVLVATIAGVNSPHPNKLKADEVELISWFILQEAMSMPTSRGDVLATTVLGSTRKFAHGPMQRLIDEGQAKVFQWCINEVMEPWPTDPSLQQEIRETIVSRYGDLDVLPDDLTRYNGYYKWRDLLTKIKTLDKETFIAQWLCRRPDSGGLIFPRFDEILNCDPNFIVDKSGYNTIQIWEDFGYAKPDHPDAIGLVQVDVRHMKATIFDELYLFEMATEDIVIEIIQKLQKHGLVDPHLIDVTKEQLRTWKIEENHVLNFSEFFTKLGLWIPDYHGLTEIKDRQRLGCPIPTPFKITHEYLHPQCQRKDCPMKNISEMYLKENGIPHVRKFVDDRRLMITPNIIDTRNDFMSYSKKRKADGTYTDDPEKKNDHGPDYCHYGLVYNFPNIAYQAFSLESEHDQKVETISPVVEDAIVPETYTGGIWDKEF